MMMIMMMIYADDDDNDDGGDDGGDDTWSGRLTLPGISPSFKSSSGLRISTKITFEH